MDQQSMLDRFDAGRVDHEESAAAEKLRSVHPGGIPQKESLQPATTRRKIPGKEISVRHIHQMIHALNLQARYNLKARQEKC